MKKVVAALLVGASMMAAAPASAAEYIEYLFGVSGQFEEANYNGGSYNVITGSRASFIKVILPSDAAGASSFQQSKSANGDPLAQPFSFSTSPTGLSFSGSESAYQGSQRMTLSVSGRVVASSNGAIGDPLGPVAEGSFQYSDAVGSGIYNRFSGSIVSVSVNRLITASNTPLGIALAVPEPATWAMMIIGFAAVGASLRGRRRSALAA